MNKYLLDTNHCSKLLAEDPALIQKLYTLAPDTLIATCVIVRGELFYMVYNSERLEENKSNVEDFLEDIDIFPLDNEIADTYGELKAALFNKYAPKEKAKRRKTKIQNLGFYDNDLWIAATAKHYGLILVSADNGFNRMKQAFDLAVENWLPA